MKSNYTNQYKCWTSWCYSSFGMHMTSHGDGFVQYSSPLIFDLLQFLGIWYLTGINLLSPFLIPFTQLPTYSIWWLESSSSWHPCHSNTSSVQFVNLFWSSDKIINCSDYLVTQPWGRSWVTTILANLAMTQSWVT